MLFILVVFIATKNLSEFDLPVVQLLKCHKQMSQTYRNVDKINQQNNNSISNISNSYKQVTRLIPTDPRIEVK